MPEIASLLCIFSLVAVLGGTILIMLYGVKELQRMFMQFIDRR